MHRIGLVVATALAAHSVSAGAPAIVTDTPVVHSLVSQVMDGLGEPVVLLEPGADPHSFQLRPSQAAALEDASIVFWVGEDLAPWLARALDTVARDAASVPLLDAEGVALLEYGDGSGAHRHDHDHGHGHGDDDGHAIDPHAWLDPANAKVWVARIAAELSAADPANAGTYVANAESALAAIDAAVAEARAALAPVAGRPIVTFHDAYGYFAHAFDVEIAGSIALGDAAVPGAQRLRELQATVDTGGIACIFREPQHDAAMAEAIAAEAGIGLGVLDPEGSSLPYGPSLYGDLLTGLARSIADCVSRSG